MSTKRVKAWSQSQDLKRQHEAFLRTGYDGHNRKPQRAAATDLRKRARRRRRKRELTQVAEEWQSIRRAERAKSMKDNTRLDPCKGHRCDLCRICRSGHCCMGRRGSREQPKQEPAKLPVVAGGRSEGR